MGAAFSHSEGYTEDALASMTPEEQEAAEEEAWEAAALARRMDP